MHELDEWPNFRWDEEAIAPLLEHARRQQVDILAYAAALSTEDAAETTVRHLTDSAVSTSQIEEEYPDPRVVKAAIRRRIAGGPRQTGQSQRDEPGIAVVTADTSTNHAVSLTAERLHEWHRALFSSPPRHDITVGRWRDDRIARAIADLALARCDGTDTRSYSMSTEILYQREDYYRALKVTQSGSMNITA